MSNLNVVNGAPVNGVSGSFYSGDALIFRQEVRSLSAENDHLILRQNVGIEIIDRDALILRQDVRKMRASAVIKTDLSCTS